MGKPFQADELYSEQETVRRRDALAKHMLSTPPKPLTETKIGKDRIEGDAKVKGPAKRGKARRSSK